MSNREVIRDELRREFPDVGVFSPIVDHMAERVHAEQMTIAQARQRLAIMDEAARAHGRGNIDPRDVAHNATFIDLGYEGNRGSMRILKSAHLGSFLAFGEFFGPHGKQALIAITALAGPSLWEDGARTVCSLACRPSTMWFSQKRSTFLRLDKMDIHFGACDSRCRRLMRFSEVEGFMDMQITRRLSGNVQLCTHAPTGKVFVVKSVFIDDESRIHAYAQLYRSLISEQARYIMPYFHVYKAEPTVLKVFMPFFNDTLASVIAKNEIEPTLSSAFQLLLSISGGLKHLHQLGTVHRDSKPK